MGEAIKIMPRLAAAHRPALEQLLFFNVNQHRVRLGIQQSIETYGVPEIHESDGQLRIQVGDIPNVQNLFAVNATGSPIGVAVFVRTSDERFIVLHLGVAPRFQSSTDVNAPVLLKLMHEIRGTARRTHGIERIELVYKHGSVLRPNG